MEYYWIRLFGTASLWGLDMGFWLSMGLVLLIVILMNVIFWGMKPRNKILDDCETHR